MGDPALPWRTVLVADLCSPGGLAGGPFGSSLGKKDYVASGVPVIRGTNLGGKGRFDSSGFVYVSEEKADSLRRNLAIPGDLVLTQRGTLGQVGLVPDQPFDRYVISQSQMRVRPDSEIVATEFLYYVFRSPTMVSRIKSEAIVTGVPHINLGLLGALSIDLPPLNVQLNIAEVLGKIDARIESNTYAAALCERILGLLPAAAEDPPTAALGTLVHTVRETVNPVAIDGPVDLYSIPAFDTDRLPDRCLADTIMSNKFLVAEPSVLLSRLNPRTPRLWYAKPESAVPSLSSTEFLMMRPTEGMSLADIWLACADRNFIDQMTSQATGTSGSHQRVRPADVLGLEVIDPRSLPKSLRNEAADLLLLAHQRRTEARSLSALRDALLPEILSGRLCVPDVEDLVTEVP